MTRRDALKRTALLLGAALAPSSITSALAQAAATPDPTVPPEPGARHFTALQRATVTALAETILPRTDTPGATDAGVPAFIEITYGKYMDAPEADRFAQGIENLNTAARAADHAPFAELDPTRQQAHLTELAASTVPSDRAFWRQLRELTLLGYFTSETAARQVLNWDPVPGRLEGDIPLSSVGGKAWFER